MIVKWYWFLAKSAKSIKSVKSEVKEDAKSDITDGNNTSAAETTIPLDDDAKKSNGDLSTKSGKQIRWAYTYLSHFKNLACKPL